MRCTAGELRKLITEAYGYHAYIKGGWLIELCDAVREEFAKELEEQEFPVGSSTPASVEHKFAKLIRTAGHITRSGAMLIADEFAQIVANNKPTKQISWEGHDVVMREVWLAIPDDEATALAAGKEARAGDNGIVYELVLVRVTDLDGHVGMTVEEQPDAVWSYDPETLELLSVPTFAELLDQTPKHGRGSHHPFARLRDIESGKL